MRRLLPGTGRDESKVVEEKPGAGEAEKGKAGLQTRLWFATRAQGATLGGSRGKWEGGPVGTSSTELVKW